MEVSGNCRINTRWLECPLVSVIVPNHNRNIKPIYDSLCKSTYDHWELIHINRGLERSEQRNIGISEAKGDMYLFLDSDQTVSPGLIKECVHLIKMGYGSIYIPEVIVAKSFFGKIRKFEREFYTGTSVDVQRFVLWCLCPTFDINLTGPEDSDWANRIQGLRAISKNVLYHHDDISLKEYIKKKIYYTKSMKKYAKKWPNDKCLNFKYRCFDVFIENGKWKKLIKHPVLSLGILFIILLRGIIYVLFR